MVWKVSWARPSGVRSLESTVNWAASQTAHCHSSVSVLSRAGGSEPPAASLEEEQPPPPPPPRSSCCSSRWQLQYKRSSHDSFLRGQTDKHTCARTHFLWHQTTTVIGVEQWFVALNKWVAVLFWLGRSGGQFPFCFVFSEILRHMEQVLHINRNVVCAKWTYHKWKYVYLCVCVCVMTTVVPQKKIFNKYKISTSFSILSHASWLPNTKYMIHYVFFCFCVFLTFCLSCVGKYHLDFESSFTQ